LSVSNYNRESCPIPGYEGEIICGPEVVNGTGQVDLAFGNSETGRCWGTLMTADQVLRLAEWLADLAWEAKRQQWRERNTLCG
jgi:hypothetical protein